jgi:flavin-dependent dehydrogenase
MGCWDKVEAAEFPVKVGATYRWGSSQDLWDFDFLSGQPYVDAARPAKYEGQRRSTAFQVDRAVFDQILLDHARSCGVVVREQCRVTGIETSDDLVNGLVLEDGSRVEARHTIDASGGSALMRRALGVPTEEPSALRNIALWAYWQNAEWAATVGSSGTRVQVLSLGWGWIWFIPVGPTRTSIGLVLPAGYYKRSGKTTEELYFEAISSESTVALLTANASCEGEVFATKDWSFVAERMAGKNWFLVGEAAGFADPILAAGISMAAVGAWEAATTIVEIERGRYDPDWLRAEFTRASARRLRSHILFADYWYTANAHFTDLVGFTKTIAEHSGLHLDAKSAWQWLGTGGFVTFGGAGIGGFNLISTDWLISQFEGEAPDWSLASNNLFRPNLGGTETLELAIYHPGSVERISGLSRDGKVLPLHGIFAFLIETVGQIHRVDQIVQRIAAEWCAKQGGGASEMANALQALEGLIQDGWISASLAPNVPLMSLQSLRQTGLLHPNYDNVRS